MPAPPPCEEPACASKSDAMKKMFSQAKPKAAGDKSAVEAAAPVACPPDRDELGRHSWTLLHTLAAYFPSTPTTAQSEAAVSFIRAVGMLYPCRHCAEDFERGLAEHPPRANSREELSVWMCEAHNRVNALLGKPAFPCVLSQLDERWRSSKRPECDLTGLAEDE
jgi:FAD-linked sulfhydryl oxidase